MLRHELRTFSSMPSNQHEQNLTAKNYFILSNISIPLFCFSWSTQLYRAEVCPIGRETDHSLGSEILRPPIRHERGGHATIRANHTPPTQQVQHQVRHEEWSGLQIMRQGMISTIIKNSLLLAFDTCTFYALIISVQFDYHKLFWISHFYLQSFFFNRPLFGRTWMYLISKKKVMQKKKKKKKKKSKNFFHSTSHKNLDIQNLTNGKISCIRHLWFPFW